LGLGQLVQKAQDSSSHSSGVLRQVESLPKSEISNSTKCLRSRILIEFNVIVYEFVCSILVALMVVLKDSRQNIN
jgi:hypothetical protein